MILPLGGAIFGGVAGLTAGVSLVYQVPALAAANVVGGVSNRAISNDPNNQPFNATSMTIDFVAGGAGGYFAPLGTTKYLAATNTQRNIDAGIMEFLLTTRPIPATLPTLYSPVTQGIIRNEINHGYAQNLSNGIVRGGTRTATTGTLNFLVNFDIARPVQSSSNNNSKRKKTKDSSSPSSGATCTTVDGGGGKKGKATMCGPFFID